MKYVCVLKTGGEYNLKYVHNLAAGLRLSVGSDTVLTCLTDACEMSTKHGINFEPLQKRFPGWWSKFEIFRLEGPLLYFDLDTVFCNRIDELVNAVQNMASDKLLMLHDFNRPEKWASGIMGWSRSRSDVSRAFMKDCQSGRFADDKTRSLRVERQRFRGDQEWLDVYVRKAGLQVVAVQDVQTGVFSYKADLKAATKCPETASVVCFHGHPRPHEMPDDHWLKQLWKGQHAYTAVG